MFLKLNNSPKHNSLRSRPPAGQHQQKGKSSFSKINKVSVNKVNVKVNVNKVNVKVNVNKVNVKVNDIYSIHSHYKGNHKRGAAARGRGTSFVMAAEGRHLCSGYE